MDNRAFIPPPFLSPPLRTAHGAARSESRILRDRQAAHSRAADITQGRQAPYSTARLLVQVYNGGSMGSAADLYYFTHPVLATGAEAEGGTATLTTDTTTTVPVVVLHHAPSVGDYLTAYSVGGRWVSEIGAPSGGGGVVCLPCDIPTSTLTVSWTNLLAGDGSAPMTHSTGPDAWTATCVDDGLIFKLGCNSGNIVLKVTFFVSGSCPTGQANFCSNGTGVTDPLLLTLTSYTCSPFSLTFSCTEAGCPAVYGAGNTQFIITA